jgi:hypothetical protein
MTLNRTGVDQNKESWRLRASVCTHVLDVAASWSSHAST